MNNKKYLLIVTIAFLLITFKMNLIDLENNTFQSKTYMSAKMIKEGKKCPEKIIFKYNSFGALGNQMMDFASMYVMGRELPDFTPFIDKGQRQWLHKAFKHTNLPELQDECRYQKKNIMNKNYSSGSLISKMLFNNISAHDEIVNYAKQVDTILFNFYEWVPMLYLKYVDELKYVFQFHDDIMREALTTLDFIHKINVDSTKPLLYVGIHFRRGDYGNHLKHFYKMELLKPSFYMTAMNYFQNKYSSEYKVVFAAVSNDDDWVRKNFEFENFYLVSKTANADMALLSLCNHSITDYGTFGMWPSLFHGGEHYTTNAYEDIIVEMMEKHPKWTVLNITTPLVTIKPNT